MSLTIEEAKRALIILKDIQNQQLKQSIKAYLTPIEHKVWYDVAEKQMLIMTLELSKFFSKQADQLFQILKDKEQLFMPKKKEEEAISKVLQAIDIIEKANEPNKYKVWEYLDQLYNRVVVEDIKDTIVEFAKSFHKELEKIYSQIITNTYEEVSQSISTDETSFEFNKSNKWVKNQIQKKVIKWSNQVTRTTEERIKRQLVKGYEVGASIFDIAKSIKANEAFSFSRAEKIARTEIFSSGNYIDYLSFNQNKDVVGYKWCSMEDSRVRPSHTRANGQFRKKGEPFTVGGSKLLYPGDNSLGAAAKEVICCRCYLDPVFYDELGLKSGKDSEESLNNDEVKSLGFINIEDQEGIEQFLESCENSIKEQPIEYAFIVSTEGEVLQVTGSTGQVHIENVGAEKLKGAIVTHNHPNLYEDDELIELGGSFSDDDLEMYCLFKLMGLRAVDAQYTYYIKLKDITLDEIKDLYDLSRLKILRSGALLSGVEMKHEILMEMSKCNKQIIYERKEV